LANLCVQDQTDIVSGILHVEIAPVEMVAICFLNLITHPKLLL